MTDAIPEGFTSLTAYLIVDNVKEALTFYKKALGAEEKVSLKMKDGSIMHAEVTIGNARLMMGQADPKWKNASAKTLGGSPVNFVIYTPNLEQDFDKAKKAGMEEKMPIEDQFWGDRMGALMDPYGIKWSFTKHVRDVSPQEMQAAMEKMASAA